MQHVEFIATTSRKQAVTAELSVTVVIEDAGPNETSLFIYFIIFLPRIICLPIIFF